MDARGSWLKRVGFNAMQLFRVARRTMRKCSQSNFETIQNTEVTRLGVTCRVRARFTSRCRQILLDLVVSPDYSVRTCLQLCRSYELCYCLRKSGRNQQTLAFTGIIICLQSRCERYKTDCNAYIIIIIIYL